MTLKCTLLDAKLEIAGNFVQMLHYFFISYKQQTVQSSLVAQDGRKMECFHNSREYVCQNFYACSLLCITGVFMHVLVLSTGASLEKPLGNYYWHKSRHGKILSWVPVLPIIGCSWFMYSMTSVCIVITCSTLYLFCAKYKTTDPSVQSYAQPSDPTLEVVSSIASYEKHCLIALVVSTC